MKKLALLMVGVALFLVGCSDEMSGESTTVCRNAPSTLMTTQPDTVVTIEGMDENILTWTERVTITPLEYGYYFWGVELSDADIRDIFDLYADPIDGLSWHIVSLDSNTLVFDAVYHYDLMPVRALNEIWEVDDFHREVTLTGAIGGLEDAGASCRID